MKNEGGGTISNTISDAIFVVIQVAKRKKMNELNIQANHPDSLKLCAYYSKNSHSSSEKGNHLNKKKYSQIRIIFELCALF